MNQADLLAVTAQGFTTIADPGDPDSSRNDIPASFLGCIAIRKDCQGLTLADGTRLSSLVVRSAIQDALTIPGRSSLVAGYVAEENSRSRSLCRREGFDEDLPAELLPSSYLDQPAPYVFVIGAFAVTTGQSKRPARRTKSVER